MIFACFPNFSVLVGGTANAKTKSTSETPLEAMFNIIFSVKIMFSSQFLVQILRNSIVIPWYLKTNPFSSCIQGFLRT